MCLQKINHKLLRSSRKEEAINEPNNRTAIALLKGVEPGVAANASAIIMGQLSRLDDEIYADNPPVDLDSQTHAGICNNVVVLTGRQGQINRLAANELEDVKTVVFSSEGRGLSNSFEQYEDLIKRSQADSLGVFAVGVSGPHDIIIDITKGLSFFK